MKGKMLSLAAAAVALVVGMVWWYGEAAPGELSPGRVVVLSESMEEGSFRWAFKADDEEGKPLETVFYTEEWSPVEGGDVDVVVRLYDSPAAGRTELRPESADDAGGAEFVLTCVRPESLARQYPNASYRIHFGGRHLGAWRMDAKHPLASLEG